MSHQDKMSEELIVVNHATVKQAVNTLFTKELFRGMHVREGATWTPRLLATVALFWACSGANGLKERFEHARKVVVKIFRWLPQPGESYVGFMKQLKKWHAKLQIACMSGLRVQMEQDLFGQWKIGGYVVIAGDGSRIELPRTKSNEDTYSPKSKSKSKNKKKGNGAKKQSPKKAKGKKKTSRGKTWRKTKRQSKESIAKKINSPQMWLTLFWHVGTGLPWAWRTGPSDSSERQHLEEMLGELPENTLITADAGFVGYDFWSALLAAGHSFVIRAGANVRLLRKLGFTREYDNTVYLWPDSAAKKGLPPLVLRAVWVHDGKHPMCLITNVLSKTKLSDRQIVKIYKARWGIEVFFRTFKQTFGRRKLLSRNADNAKLEAEWSLLALWAICLLAQREIGNGGGDPCQLSAVGAIKAIQEVLCHYRCRPEGIKDTLAWMFRNALLDDYQRTSSKTARAYPAKKKRQRTGVPKIERAPKPKIAAAKELKKKRAAFRLTA